VPFADVWAPIGAVATLGAAVAALVTVFFARATVVQARAQRTEAAAAHGEAMRHENSLLMATVDAHHREMAERGQAIATERVLQRLAQLSTIIELLREITDIARDEQVHPPV
jgi:hypothetical protein